MAASEAATGQSRIELGHMMKAIVQYRYGPPDDVLQFREIDKPVIGDDEVLVRVRAASVHPDVWHVVTGRPYVLRLMRANAQGDLRSHRPRSFRRCGQSRFRKHASLFQAHRALTVRQSAAGPELFDPQQERHHGRLEGVPRSREAHARHRQNLSAERGA